MDRKVMGVFFLDYVRMIKNRKDIDWSRRLTAADTAFLQRRLADEQWYPMKTFERFGLAILSEIARGDMNLVRIWGRAQADDLARKHPEMVCEGDPRESMVRFQVVRGSYFNFEAVNIMVFFHNHAELEIHYHLSDLAEQAASWQTAGYFERLLELSGATSVQVRFSRRAWEGDPITALKLDWSNITADQKVKGSLFRDYVRMIKGLKVDWSRRLRPADLEFLDREINEAEWYPMESFERMGAGILEEIAHGDLEQVRVWGKMSVKSLADTHPSLVCPGDPLETLYRFQVLRRGFFNFSAVDIKSISGHYAKIQVDYDMGRTTEAAATYQTLGFFEQLLELAGAKNLKSSFICKSWEGNPTTIIELDWA